MTLREVRVWAMVPTPFTADGRSVDLDSLVRLVLSMVTDGCQGLICLGVIAEPHTLSPEERTEILSVVMSTVAVPVIAGVMALNEDEHRAEVDRLRQSAGRTVDGILVPVHSRNPVEVRERLRRMKVVTGVPAMLQDLPRATGVEIGTADLLRAVDRLGVEDAVKCESPPTPSRIRRLTAATGATLVSGLGGLGLVDDLLAGATAAAVGVTLPGPIAGALTATRSGDLRTARSIIGRYADLFAFETQPGPSIAIRKEHWRRRGLIASAAVRTPTRRWAAALDQRSRELGYPPAG